MRKPSYTNMVRKSKEEVELSDKPDLNFIENYFIKNTHTNNKISQNINEVVNSVRLEEIFSSNSKILSPDKKRKLDILVDEHLLSFKKTDLNSSVFPSLMNYWKALFEKVKKSFPPETEMNNKSNARLSTVSSEQLYYILRIQQSMVTLESKVFDFYLHLIKKKNFGISKSISSNITSEIKYSNEYMEFLNKLASWYSSSEIIIFNLFILHLFFNVPLNFDSTKFSVEKNIEFSLNHFAKKNFYYLSSTILKHADLGIRLFGTVNYANIAMIILSGVVSGQGLVKMFLSNYFYHYAMAGTYIFNWLVGSITGYMDGYVATSEYYRISEVLDKLNKKLETISISSNELILLLILKECNAKGDLKDEDYLYLSEKLSNKLATSTGENGYQEEDKKPLNNDNENKNNNDIEFNLTESKLISTNILDSKIEELNLLLERFLLKVDDVSEKELKEIDAQTIKWVEETIKYQDIIKSIDHDNAEDSNNKIDVQNNDEIEKFMNGSCLQISTNKSDLKNRIIEEEKKVYDLDKLSYRDDRDWVLINIIKGCGNLNK